MTHASQGKKEPRGKFESSGAGENPSEAAILSKLPHMINQSPP